MEYHSQYSLIKSNNYTRYGFGKTQLLSTFYYVDLKKLYTLLFLGGCPKRIFLLIDVLALLLILIISIIGYHSQHSLIILNSYKCYSFGKAWLSSSTFYYIDLKQLYTYLSLCGRPNTMYLLMDVWVLLSTVAPSLIVGGIVHNITSLHWIITNATVLKRHDCHQSFVMLIWSDCICICLSMDV